MIKRNIEAVVEDTIKHYPITLITGPGQIGKYTMLYNSFSNKGYSYVSFDDSLELSLAKSDSKTFIELHPTPLIIDEAQKAPEIFPELERVVNESRLRNEITTILFIISNNIFTKGFERINKSR